MMSRIAKTASGFWPIVALLALLLVFFNQMVFSNLILARGDTFLYFYPYWEAAGDALRHGRVPLWNDAIFMGAPLLANSQVGFFYPFNWPVWLLLRVPYAISASIVLHLALAGLGAYFAARRVLGVGRTAGLVTAVSFALGGYLTAQVEHINQLQGLAWLPWFLLVLARPLANGGWRGVLRRALAVALLFALQLTAGHTQSTFITGVGVGLWLLVQTAQTWRRARPVEHLRRLVPLALGALLAVLLTAVQLLPTLELAGLSSRQGGLSVNEVLAFSLNPLLVGRALLPAVQQPLFSEYLAVLPLTALALALVGAWQWRRSGVLPTVVWVIAGLLLALGIFNPANWLLARLPGFDLFRVPARWLILYALGVALLAGVGWDALVATWSRSWSSRGDEYGEDPEPKQVTRPLLLALLLMLALMVWRFVAPLLAGVVPVGPEAPVALPNLLTLAIWIVELAFLGLLYWLTRSGRVHGRLNAILRAAALLLLLLVLFLTTRTHPYNQLTTPEAYFDLRPPVARLQAATAEQAATAVPPGRVLGLSEIFFDVGDQTEIDSIYAGILSPEALYDYTIAIKHKEVLSPNLPLAYGLASVDGFDGGILPLRSYSDLMTLLLPAGETTTDGRLRENLDAVPEARWLDLFNAQFIITDKVGDAWRDEVFFDQQHPVVLGARAEAAIGYLPAYEATELWLLADAAPGPVAVTTTAGTLEITPEPAGDDLYRTVFPEPLAPQAIVLRGCEPACTIRAVTLVDGRDETFQPLVPGGYRLIHSGDVKIYENLDVLPRTWLVGQVNWQPDATSVLAAMQSADFDPGRTAVLLQPAAGASLPAVAGHPVTGRADIALYAPEAVVVDVVVDAPAVLLLTDAAYPGWQATVDGAPVDLFTADGLFRAVFVPAGAHQVVFHFAPQSYRTGLMVTLAAVIGFAALLAVAVWRRTA